MHDAAIVPESHRRVRADAALPGRPAGAYARRMAWARASILGGAITLAGAALVPACTYDFDAPFAGTPGTGATTSASSSTGAGGGEGGGGATGTGGEGGGGAPLGEDCSNGVDDDGDVYVDCADPDCGAWGCTAAAPPGWTGPIAVYLGAPDDPAPTCASAWPSETTTFAGPVDAPPASCDACTCDPPTGGSCGLAATIVNDALQCFQIESTLMPAAADTCASFSTSDLNTGFRGQIPPITSPASCAPAGGAATLPPPAWSQRAVVCSDAPVGLGCLGVGEVCAPRPAAPFGAKLCVEQVGDLDCPPGAYTQKTTLFGGADDTRSCSACACGNPGGATCSGTTTIFDGPGCVNPLVDVPHNNTCVQLSSAPSLSLSYRYKPGTPGGTCNASGGAPLGNVTPKDPVTVCCAP